MPLFGYTLGEAERFFNFMEKEKDNKWWVAGVRMFGEISVWIVVPIVLALFIGKYLDNKYDSAPWLFLGCTALAFIISIFGIWKILSKYLKEIEKEILEKKKNNKDGKSSDTK